MKRRSFCKIFAVLAALPFGAAYAARMVGATRSRFVFGIDPAFEKDQNALQIFTVDGSGEYVSRVFDEQYGTVTTNDSGCIHFTDLQGKSHSSLILGDADSRLEKCNAWFDQNRDAVKAAAHKSTRRLTGKDSIS